ncbi:GIY-YIG nuclease family protein [Mycobacterium intracellulare]|uniref:GIY-YIG nuclease family protein n=1 Tax=Mycobacterium intracellulare TaxID=1767 RepID=UPI00109EDD68|nr:GIY-YIG nuclease family protein [Mycobacterium intracellulare]
MNNERHVLYRFYNAREELLYIGITRHPMARFRSHQKDKTWWPEVAAITVENHASRNQLMIAERRAIMAEKPLYNKAFNDRAADEPKSLRGHRLEAVVANGLAPSVRWLQDGIRAKRIPAHKLGRHWVMTDDDIDQMLELRASKPEAPSSEAHPLSLTATSMRRQKWAS